jgi:chromosome segregation ATPase
LDTARTNEAYMRINEQITGIDRRMEEIVERQHEIENLINKLDNEERKYQDKLIEKENERIAEELAANTSKVADLQASEDALVTKREAAQAAQALYEQYSDPAARPADWTQGLEDEYADAFFALEAEFFDFQHEVE